MRHYMCEPEHVRITHDAIPGSLVALPQPRRRYEVLMHPDDLERMYQEFPEARHLQGKPLTLWGIPVL